jgi:hypothetical protein
MNVAGLSPVRGLPRSTILTTQARKLLAQAVPAALETLLATFKSLKDKPCRRAVMRNGYLPPRQVITGIGDVNVQVPKTRDRSRSGLHFTSSWVPSYLKRTKSPDERFY